MLLAGDVGGTKTALALFDRRDGALVLERETELSSREFPSLEDAVARFLASPRRLRIDAACFGVAGPVVDGRSVTTNLPWQIDEATLRARIPARRVRLLNDLEATGYGVLTLPPTALAPLQPGTRRRGTVALIAAGTGLGEALLIWDGQRHLVVASEGGHADFAPRTDLEVELLRFLRKEFGRVSCERVLSGPGLFNIYRFLRDTGDVPEPSWLGDRIARGDPSAVVSEVGLAGAHPLCVQALDL
ncbi:MAG: glucokinase, partial [Candidatus Rokubacteria bacterium 13_1_20CM_2_69_58]